MEDDLRQLLAVAAAQSARLCSFELDCVCREFLRGAAEADPWVPFPEPTRVHIVVDERGGTFPYRRYRAEYDPQVVRWYPDAAAFANTNPAEQRFVVSTVTEIGDGHQTTSYSKRHRWRSSIHRQHGDIHLTGEHFLLCRFGRRKFPDQIDPVEPEPVRLARAILEPGSFGTGGIVTARTVNWETREDGRRVLRLEQVFTGGGRHLYHLDPARGYALIRFAEAQADGQPETVFEVEELNQVADDFWVPARVTSRQLCPSPQMTSPVRVRPRHPPAGSVPGVNADKDTHWATRHRARLPRGDQTHCEFEFSGVRVAIEVSSDAFEFHPPP